MINKFNETSASLKSCCPNIKVTLDLLRNIDKVITDMGFDGDYRLTEYIGKDYGEPFNWYDLHITVKRFTLR